MVSYSVQFSRRKDRDRGESVNDKLRTTRWALLVVDGKQISNVARDQPSDNISMIYGAFLGAPKGSGKNDLIDRDAILQCTDHVECRHPRLIISDSRAQKCSAFRRLSYFPIPSCRDAFGIIDTSFPNDDALSSWIAQAQGSERGPASREERACLRVHRCGVHRLQVEC